MRRGKYVTAVLAFLAVIGLTPLAAASTHDVSVHDTLEEYAFDPRPDYFLPLSRHEAVMCDSEHNQQGAEPYPLEPDAPKYDVGKLRQYHLFEVNITQPGNVTFTTTSELYELVVKPACSGDSTEHNTTWADHDCSQHAVGTAASVVKCTFTAPSPGVYQVKTRTGVDGVANGDSIAQPYTVTWHNETEYSVPYHLIGEGIRAAYNITGGYPLS